MRLVYLALGWCAGILLAANAEFRQPTFWLILAFVALVLTLRFRRVEAAALLLLALGGLRMTSVPLTSELAAYNDLGGMTVEGIVSAEPDRRDDRVQLRLDAQIVTRAGRTTSTSGTVLVYAPPLTDARYGDRVAATGLLLTPGESDRFSYADYLARSGVHSLMRETSVTVLERGAGDSLFSRLIDLRASAADRIRQHLPEPQAGLLVGILLGSERGISPEVSDAFAATGAAHVIAISGFNMAILSGVIIGVLRRLQVRPLPAALTSIAIIGIYTLLVGANPAVVRAALMSGLLVVGTALRRDTYLPASLAFAALLLSALNPLVLWDVGFQLSFFATLGLALFAAPYGRLLASLPRPQRGKLAASANALIFEPLATTLAATTFTLPLTMLYFGQVSPFILLVNLLIIPVQPLLLLLGIAATLIAFFLPPLAQLLYWLELLPLSWTIEVVRLFARVPTLEVFVSPNLIAVFFIVAAGGAMLKAAQPRWSLRLTGWVSQRIFLSATLLSAIGMLILIAALLLSRPDGLLHLWMLDMGGSNALLIQTPRGAHILIDGGRFPSRLLTALGDRLPFTKHSLEMVILTQPDEMQFGALPAVLPRYPPAVFLSSGQPNLGDTFAALQAQVASSPQAQLSAGYVIETDDGVRLETLNPTRQPSLATPLDEGALVLRLSYGEIAFLLTSDLSREAQEALTENGTNLNAAVLQLPSRIDADFVASVQPQIAITQLEDANPDELAKLGGIPVYQTATGGTIHLTTNGRELYISQERVPAS